MNLPGKSRSMTRKEQIRRVRWFTKAFQTGIEKKKHYSLSSSRKTINRTAKDSLKTQTPNSCVMTNGQPQIHHSGNQEKDVGIRKDESTGHQEDEFGKKEKRRGEASEKRENEASPRMLSSCQGKSYPKEAYQEERKRGSQVLSAESEKRRPQRVSSRKRDYLSKKNGTKVGERE